MSDVRVMHKPGLGGWAVYDYEHEYHFVRGTFSTREQAEKAAADWLATHPRADLCKVTGCASDARATGDTDGPTQPSV